MIKLLRTKPRLTLNKLQKCELDESKLGRSKDFEQLYSVLKYTYVYYHPARSSSLCP